MQLHLDLIATCGWWHLQAKPRTRCCLDQALVLRRTSAMFLSLMNSFLFHSRSHWVKISLVIQAFLFHLYCTGNRFSLPLKAVSVLSLPKKSSSFVSVPDMLAQESTGTRLSFLLPLPLSLLDAKVFPDFACQTRAASLQLTMQSGL